MAVATSPNILLDSTIDGRTHVRFFERKVGFNFVLDELNLSRDMRATFNEDQPGERRHSDYRDSGLWWRYRSLDHKRSMMIEVDVGCFCAHDCCGCVCGMSHELTLTSDFIVVITRTRRNV